MQKIPAVEDALFEVPGGLGACKMHLASSALCVCSEREAAHYVSGAHTRRTIDAEEQIPRFGLRGHVTPRTDESAATTRSWSSKLSSKYSGMLIADA